MKRFGIGVGAAVLFIVGCVVWALFRPELLVWSVRAVLLESGGWRAPVLLTPDVFEKGTSRSRFESSLGRAGYEPAPASRRAVVPGVSPDVAVFFREADAFPCNREIYVAGKFDREDGLVEATGYLFERGCL